MLEAKGWARCNFRFLHKWLIEQEASHRPEIAVFDFDNTSIFQDIGEAVLRWQLEHKAFRFDTKQFAAIIAPPPSAPEALEDGTPLAPFLEQMTEHFEKMMGKDKQAHHNFIIQFFHLYNAGTKTAGLGAPYTYLLCAKMLAGYQVDEIYKLVKHVAVQEGVHAGKIKSWKTYDAQLLGAEAVEYRLGIKAQPEIIDLMKALKKAHVTPHIVTASCQHIVEPLLRLWEYPITPHCLYGIRMQQLGNKLTEIPLPNYPIPIEQGKVELIKKELSREPILVAGDSYNDRPMLTHFDKTEIRLIIHRPNKGLDDLYADAVQEGKPSRGFPTTLVQGRDPQTGKFNRATNSV